MTNHDDPIQPLRRPEDCAPIQDAEDLRRRWRSVMGHGGFGRAQLWWLWLDPDGYMLPPIMSVDDLDTGPDDLFVTNFAMIVDNLCSRDPGMSAALCLTRPGPSHLGSSDKAWARELTHALAAVGRDNWPIHLATRDSVRPVTRDDWAERSQPA